MIVYVSGPMTGYPAHNTPAFDLAQKHLESFGFDVVNPADIAREHGVSPDTHVDNDLRKALILADLEALAYCDAVYVLPGWGASGGVALELKLADYCGIPHFESISDLLVFREGKAA